MCSGSAFKNFWSKGLCVKRPQSLISYDLILLTQGELSQLSRRNTVDAAYLLRTSRSASMVQATGGDDIKPRRSKRGRGSSVASSEGSQRSGSVVNKGRPKIEARHLVI